MSNAIWDDGALVARFWAKVDVRAPDECWPWLGGNVRGRGQFSVNGRWMLAPRISLIFKSQAWPSEGLFACHRCDNPSCVNPKHLWWGTNSENIKDALAKGLIERRRNGDVCRRGHILTADNITGRGRECKACRHASKMRWQRERRAQARNMEAHNDD
jgi:hypothetical protein